MNKALRSPVPILFLSLSSGFLTGCEPSTRKATQKPPPALTVQAVHAKQGDIYRSISLPAELFPYQQATLYAKVAGYLKHIFVDKGDRVKEGDLLAEIEVPEMLADLAKYKAEAEVARIDYQRVSDAFKKAPDLVIPQTVDNAKAKWDVAQANLERTDTLLKYSRIVAPFSGIITKRMVDPGAFIPAATSGSAAQTAAVVTLMDSSRIRVQVAAPESEVPYISKGIPVNVTIEELPGRSFDGEVTRDSHALDVATKTILAEIELENPNGQLRPGMYANAKIFPEKRTNTLLIPVAALVAEKVGASVFTIVDSKAKKIPVKTGFNDGTNVEVLNGLKPDQPVILVAKQPIADGQPVQASEAK
jgi:RND family efflux transporter MFP subunit